MFKYRSTDFLRLGSYKRGPTPLELPVPNVPAVDEVRVVFSHLGATSRTKAFMFWLHTSFLPPTKSTTAAGSTSKRHMFSKGGDDDETGGRFLLGKAELDKACNDAKHLVFPEVGGALGSRAGAESGIKARLAVGVRDCG